MPTRPLRTLATLAVGFGAAACGGDGVGPGGAGHAITVWSGDGQFAEPGDMLADPLEVVVTDGDGKRVEGAMVAWDVTAGLGASLTAASTATDSLGIARTRLRLGEDLGGYRVEAAVPGMTGVPAAFQVEAVLRPRVDTIAPDPARAGETVSIAGANFHAAPDANVVLFENIRGTVLSASSSRLDVQVPACLPARTSDAVAVTVQLGPVRSPPETLRVIGGSDGSPDLAVGEELNISDPEVLSCLRLPGTETGRAFLLVPQNATDAAGRDLPFRIAGVIGDAPPVPVTRTPAPSQAPRPPLAGTGHGDFAAEWEARLRLRERQIPADAVLRPPARERELRYGLTPAATAPPAVGSSRTFKVVKDGAFVDVTATVQHVSAHAIFYQDVDAPAGGFGQTDFEALGQLFDDPIYDVGTTAFGEPSDIDGNEHVIILFTPVVNQYTPRGSEGGFVGGFFYGFDLSRGEGSNQAEIFYSLVPDPNGDFGDQRSKSDVLATVRPILAHEFQHMIHFNQRRILGNAPSSDALWLSEALAHMTEELVGEELRTRGDPLWPQFKTPNYVRASRYLESTADVSLNADAGGGTLEERGAGWLFLMHLVGHYDTGDAPLLERLTRSTLSGVANVTAETGTAWATLVRDWSVALWADDAPELAGAAIDTRFTFPNLNLRQVYADLGAAFPLQPVTQGFEDFILADTLAAASPLHLIIRHGALDATTMSFGMSGVRGERVRPKPGRRQRCCA